MAENKKKRQQGKRSVMVIGTEEHPYRGIRDLYGIMDAGNFPAFKQPRHIHFARAEDIEYQDRTGRDAHHFRALLEMNAAGDGLVIGVIHTLGHRYAMLPPDEMKFPVELVLEAADPDGLAQAVEDYLDLVGRGEVPERTLEGFLRLALVMRELRREADLEKKLVEARKDKQDTAA